MSAYKNAVSAIGSLTRCQYGKCECEAVDNYAGRAVCIGHKDYLQTKHADDLRAAEEARQWLDANGVTKPGMTKPERMKATAAFCKKVGGNFGDMSKDWASALYSRHLDGEYFPAQPVALAQQVLGITETTEQREAA